MSRLNRGLCQGLVFSILGLMVAVPLWAAEHQRDTGNWASIKQLAPGQEIKVVLNNAKAYQGQLQTVSDEGLVVRLAGGDQTLTRESILRISSKRHAHRGRNVFLGAAIGAGVGFGIGYAKRGNSGDGADLIGPLFGPVIGVGAGAGAGAAMPTGGWQDVYRAR
jgi:hypothetical protein